MLFNTIEFYAIFLAFLMVFAVLRAKSRTLMLLWVIAFSLFFYAKANATLVALLPVTAFLSWALTKRMADCGGSLRKRWMWFIVILDLVPLIYFKYTNFGIDVWNTVMGENMPLLKIALPVGISFYTFQAISYTVDVYRRRFMMDVDFMEYLFYLSFFPLLLAGPITRPGTLLPQLRQRKAVELELLYKGLFLVMLGVIKKCVIADYIAQYNNWIFNDPMMYSGFENLMGLIGYTVQIYCDFSGYSDMSIGLAAMMGFRLKDNFNFPYQSLNITEFWRRWHISLSTWFRDYLYIPMGGNRKGKGRTYLNNFVTMLVAGLWHGSTLMYVGWGALHGMALVIHKAFKPVLLDRIPNILPVRVLSWIVCWSFIVVSWSVFRAPDCATLGKIYTQIYTTWDWAYLPVFAMARPMWVAVVALALVLHGIRESWYNASVRMFVRLPWIIKLLLMMVVLQLAIEFYTSSVQPFLYYQY